MTKTYDVRPDQSIELLKELHILTRDGKMNQDSRRKLKQIYHLYQFIEPLLEDTLQEYGNINLVDHGAGKSYLGFILYDLFFKKNSSNSSVWGIETRPNLILNSINLAKLLGFKGMHFLNESVADSISSLEIPQRIDVVTALHACDTATDDAIRFALLRGAKHIVLIPCCQAEVAAALRKNRKPTTSSEITELWRHPIHAREFGSHLTNVLRCLQLEANGYHLTVTELVGWEHSMKNELIIATKKQGGNRDRAKQRIDKLLTETGLDSLRERFFT